jgi:transposase
MKKNKSTRNNSKYTTDKARVAISMMNEGESLDLVAKAIGVTRVTLYRWSKKYKMFGKEFQKVQKVRSRNRGAFFRVMNRKRVLIATQDTMQY